MSNEREAAFKACPDIGCDWGAFLRGFQAGAEWQRTQAQSADALVEALDALIADYDGEIHNEYDGTSMLDSRLSEIDYAREALAAYRAAMRK